MLGLKPAKVYFRHLVTAHSVAGRSERTAEDKSIWLSIMLFNSLSASTPSNVKLRALNGDDRWLCAFDSILSSFNPEY